MNFILGFDWSDRNTYTEDFIKEEDIENSAIKKIIIGEFRNPLSSSESEEDSPEKQDAIKKFNANIDKTVKKPPNEQTQLSSTKPRFYIPGLKSVPAYPKQSTLSTADHYQCLKVLVKDDPVEGHTQLFGPSRKDLKTFDDLKEQLKKEQEEFKKWVPIVWKSGLCSRCLQINPLVENIFDGDFDIRMFSTKQLPQEYEMVAQPSLFTNGQSYIFEHLKDIVPENNKLQLIGLPRLDSMNTIITDKVPKPQLCQRHPILLQLPNGSYSANSSLDAIYTTLAEFACRNATDIIARGSALTAIVKNDADWTVPVVVKSVQDGGKLKNIIVIDKPIDAVRPHSRIRIKRAFDLMLRHCLFSERDPTFSETEEIDNFEELDITKTPASVEIDLEDSDDENLVIDMDHESNEESSQYHSPRTRSQSLRLNSTVSPQQVNQCTCKESHYARRFGRSYKKWQLRPAANAKGHRIKVIVHTSHKMQLGESEVILNPIPEYMPEYGGAAISEGDHRAKALDLHLRDKAKLLTARIDVLSGEIMKFSCRTKDELEAQHNRELMSHANNTMYTLFNKLMHLAPGQYVLQHGVGDGDSAVLFAARSGPLSGPSIHKLSLKNDVPIDMAAIELKAAQISPTLCDVLLPIHLYRKILPLTFTPYTKQVKTTKEALKKKDRAAKLERKKAEIKKQRNKKKRLKRKNRGNK